MASITLCVIAKNEEAMLPQLFESVRELVDEIILVDTGSTDQTVPLAERAGAKVLRQPWKEDFSAPRNAAILAAKGDWILQLDADERLAPGAAKAVREAISRNDFDCGMLRLHNALRLDAPADQVVKGQQRLGEPVFLPRLLRHTADLQYRGLIHETVGEWLVRGPRQVRFLEADIVHLGNVPELRKERGKIDRNIGLLRKRCEVDAHDVTPFGYLAFELLETGHSDEAVDVIERGWAVVDEQPKNRSVLRLGVARAMVQANLGDGEGVLATVEKTERFDGSQPDLEYLKGLAHELFAMRAPSGSKEREERLEKAAAALEKVAGSDQVSCVGHFVVGGMTFAGWTRLGTVYLLQGRAKEALAAFDKALAHKADHVEALLGRVEAVLDTGEPEKALELVDPLLSSSPDAWLLAASTAEALGSLDEARALFARVRELVDKGYLARHRLERHVAMASAFAAYAGQPLVGPGPLGMVCALMAREPSRADAGLPSAEQVTRLVGNLVRLGRLELIEPLLEPRAEALLPGLPQHVSKVAEFLGVSLDACRAPSPVILVGADAVLAALGEVLGAHPRFLVEAAPAALFSATTEATKNTAREELSARPRAIKKRLVWTTPRWSDAQALAEANPRVRVVRLRPASDGTPPGPPGRTLDLVVEHLAAGPTRQLERLFAFLGEVADLDELSSPLERHAKAWTNAAAAVGSPAEQPSLAEETAEVPAYYRFERPEVAALVPAKGARILDLGCAAGAMGASLKKRGAAEVVGVELSPRAARLARTRIDAVHELDLSTLTELPYPAGHFDVMTFADVLEHLVDPVRTLKALKKYLSAKGLIVCSIPNVRHESVLLPLLVHGQWSYADAGILDRTHLRFFTLSGIGQLCDEAGFEMTGPLQAVRTEASPAVTELSAWVKNLGGDPERFRGETTVVQYLFTATPRPGAA